MEKIIANIDELKSKADELVNSYGEMEKIAQNNLELVEDLVTSGFKGVAAATYEGKFQSWQETIKAKTEMVNEIARTMKVIANNLEQAKSKNQDQINKLPF